MLHKKYDSRSKEVWNYAEENKPVERNEIVKGYAGAGRCQAAIPNKRSTNRFWPRGLPFGSHRI